MKRRSTRTPHNPPANTASKSPTNPVSVHELALVMAMLVVGAGLRILAPAHLAVEHFDEGVYASNLWFGADEGYQYPARPLYAPALMPFLIEVCVAIVGPEGLGPMLPNILAGTATVGLVWWTARGWLGPAGGVAAMAFAAFSEPHILFSRTALTDVLLCFWILGATTLANVAHRRQDWRFAAAAGFAAGLAWWTKYNGWLAIGIVAGGAAAWVLTERASRRDSWRAFVLASIVMVVAAAIWMPQLALLQQFAGGYGAVAANHATYVVGLKGWLTSAETQLANLKALDGLGGAAGVGLGIFLAFAPHQRSGRRVESWRVLGVSIVAAATCALAAALFGSLLPLGVLAVGGFAMRIGASLRSRGDASSGAKSEFMTCMACVWFMGLTLATPLYHPYPRLTLPWVVATWLGAAAGAREIARIAMAKERLATLNVSASTWRAVASVAAVLATGGAIVASVIFQPWRSSAWQPRTGLRLAAERIHHDVARASADDSSEGRSHAGQIVLVYAEPALFYHLSAIGRRESDMLLTAPVADLSFADNPAPSHATIYLAAGLHARRMREFEASIRERAGRLECIGVYSYLASDVVLSDHFASKEWNSRRRQSVSLYRLK